MVIYVLNAQDFLMIRTDDLPILEHTKQQEKVRRWATHPLKSWFLTLSQGKLQLKYKRFQRKNSKSEHDKRNYVINVCVTVFPIRRKVKAITVSDQRRNPSNSSQQHSERKTTRSNPNRYTTPVQEKKGYHYNMLTLYH